MEFQIMNCRILPPLVVRYSIFSILSVLFNVSCAAQKSGGIAYYEDLSVHRPKFSIVEDTASKHHDTTPVEAIVTKPTRNVNAKVDGILDSIDRFNLTKRFVDGFTIQIYSGQKREDAMNTKQKIIEDTPELIANLQYIQPKFRVTVGHYLTKLDAHKDLTRLKRFFSTAILVPEKILIR
jgi:hypothetical protein